MIYCSFRPDPQCDFSAPPTCLHNLNSFAQSQHTALHPVLPLFPSAFAATRGIRRVYFHNFIIIHLSSIFIRIFLCNLQLRKTKKETANAVGCFLFQNHRPDLPGSACYYRLPCRLKPVRRNIPSCCRLGRRRSASARILSPEPPPLDVGAAFFTDEHRILRGWPLPPYPPEFFPLE